MFSPSEAATMVGWWQVVAAGGPLCVARLTMAQRSAGLLVIVHCRTCSALPRYHDLPCGTRRSWVVLALRRHADRLAAHG